MTRAIIVLLEGPDAAGKSTWADNLEAVIAYSDVYRIHNGPPENATREQLFNQYSLQLQLAVSRRDRMNTSTIIDRSFVSEAIYGPIYRGGSLLSKSQIRRLEKYCTKHNILKLAVDSPLPLRVARMVAREEHIDKHVGPIGIEYYKYFQSHKGWITVSGTLANS